MKFVSWNVNGLRACMNKGFLDSFYALDADFFCLQETKLQEGQISLDLPGYQQFWCYADKKGYSGTAIFTKHSPMSVAYGLGIPELDTEGRLITLEYQEFYLVTCYTPNAQRGLARIDHRLKWESAFRSYLQELDAKKPVIICGDLNVAHKEIDLKNPSSNRGNAGFSDEERNAFSKLLSCGFTDTFRHLYPNVTGAYSWWSYMFNARSNNAGWRIDYFVVSDRLKDAIHDATIHPDIMGSDHCPVGLDLNITCNGSIWSPETQRKDDTDKKETGGNSPAGPFWMVGIFLLLTIVLLVPTWMLLRQKPEPTETLPTELSTTASPVRADLILQVIDRSKTAKWVSEYSDDNPSAPYVAYYIADGEDKWQLQEITRILPNGLVDESSKAGYYNYFVQVVFTDDYIYNSENKPEIQPSPFCTGNIRCYLAYYQNDVGHIAGCFIYGHAPAEIKLEITALFHGMIDTENAPIIVPAGIFDDYSTEQLVDFIQSSGVIMTAIGAESNFHADPIDKLVRSNPYIQELLNREDAIRVLFDEFQENPYPLTSSVIQLLYHESFQAMMTEEEKAELQTIRDSIDFENATPVYG